MAADPLPPPVAGFRTAAVAAGLKKHGGPDLALIAADVPAVAAGTFTTNRMRAAPVLLDLERIRRGYARAVIVNSGCANACTGPAGYRDAVRTARGVARALGVSEPEVLVASTGVIGKRLPLARIERALPRLVAALSPRGVPRAARAILTTDTFPKMAWRVRRIGGAPVTVVGFAKGAGMLEPHMAPPHATMLAFLMTDATVERRTWGGILAQAVEATFNRITVDGDTSTNDTVLALASGRSAREIRKGGSDRSALARLVAEVCGDLARFIAKDGEGATKLVEVRIEGGRTPQEAEAAAYRVARSPLVKTAVYGEDANWGRILAAVGNSGARFVPEAVDCFLGPVAVVRRGRWCGPRAEARATAHLRREEVLVRVHLHAGRASARVLTCDLTEGYIRENAAYRS